uniref:HTH psq-type domain-containing protein n=1 Tax=Bursaphelenchus xylophilus TaxID=6326 RepID=A0A1I7S7N3_BURXY
MALVDIATPLSSPERRKKKPYKELTLAEKVELIRLAENNSNLSQASIAELYEIAKSNVCRILQRKTEYLRAFESAKFAGSRKRKLRNWLDENEPIKAKKSTCSEPADAYGLGNETLRAHMLKQHQISRMFMCRCCNWAFPDKTSLHMHMQGKSEGASKSLNVPVIGKGIPPISSPPTQPLNFSNDELFNNVLAAQLNNPQLRNAFPALNPMNLAGMGLNPTVSTSFASSVIKPGITSPLTPSSTASGASCENPQSSLFPQLSMMPRDNADLFSKLRDRLFLNNLWLPGGNLMNMAQFAAHNTTEGTEGNSEENVFNIFSNPNVFATQPDQMAAKALSTSQQQALQTLMQQFMQKSEKPDVNDSNNNDTNNNVDNEKDVEVKVESEPEEPAAPSLEIQEDHSSHQPFSAGASPTNSNSSASPSNNSSCFDCQVAKTKLMELSLEIQKIRQQKTQADQELSEKNEALARRLTEIRARLAKFMEEPEAANNSDFVREIMRFTMLQ